MKIDTLVSFRVKLNDSQAQTTVQEMLSLRVKACEIVHLKLPFVGIFKNPLLVKEIVFTNSSKENVKRLLSTCTDLEKIAFFTTFLGDKFFDLNEDIGKLNPLKKLKEIEVGIQVFNTKGDARSSVFETLFVNPNLLFPSLRRLFVHYPMCAAEWIHLFRFIGRHAGTLKSLKLRCFDCPLGMSEIPVPVIKELKRMNLSTLEIICNCNCGEFSYVHDAFSGLVAAQSSLETLTLDFHKCPLKGIKDVIRKCGHTLQSVKLCQVEFGLDDDLQGSMFSECVRLHELKLYCQPRLMVYVSLDLDQPDSQGPSKPVAKGAETFGWSFPKSLKQFSAKSCHIPTEELIEMSGEDGCRKLEQIELYEVGTSESFGYGLTFHAFLKICENLPHLELFTFRSASYSAPENVQSENVRWRLILDAGKEFGVYSETPVYHSFDFGIRNCVAGADGNLDLSGLFSFRFRGSGQRHKFLDRVHEL